MMWTNDPVADAERYAAEQERKLDELPKCCECDHPIQTEKCFEFNGELMCPQCLKDYHEKWTEDFCS